jgi:hypothetical protein
LCVNTQFSFLPVAFVEKVLVSLTQVLAQSVLEQTKDHFLNAAMKQL